MIKYNRHLILLLFVSQANCRKLDKVINQLNFCFKIQYLQSVAFIIESTPVQTVLSGISNEKISRNFTIIRNKHCYSSFL